MDHKIDATSFIMIHHILPPEFHKSANWLNLLTRWNLQFPVKAGACFTDSPPTALIIVTYLKNLEQAPQTIASIKQFTANIRNIIIVLGGMLFRVFTFWGSGDDRPLIQYFPFPDSKIHDRKVSHK